MRSLAKKPPPPPYAVFGLVAVVGVLVFVVTGLLVTSIVSWSFGSFAAPGNARDALALARQGVLLCPDQTCDETSMLTKIGDCYRCGIVLTAYDQPAVVIGSINVQNLVPQMFVTIMSEVPYYTGIVPNARQFFVTFTTSVNLNVISNNSHCEVDFSIPAPTLAQLGDPVMYGGVGTGNGGAFCCYGATQRFPTCGPANFLFDISPGGGLRTFSMFAAEGWSAADQLTCTLSGQLTFFAQYAA